MEVMKVEAKVTKYKHSIKNTYFKRFEIEKAHIYSRDFKLTQYAPNTNDIHSICFDQCVLAEFPRAQILLDLVKNLTSLYIFDCNLAQINGDNLCELGSLNELYLGYNSIEKLPKGLFVHTPDLEIVSFWHNRIKETDENILDPLKRLKYFNLLDNLKINVRFDSINNEGNVTLAQLKEEIRKCRPTEEIIKNLERENDNVKVVNAGLTKEVDALKTNHETIRKKIAEMSTAYSNMKIENQNLKISDELLRKEVAELKTNCAKIIAGLNQPEVAKFKPFNFTVVVNGKDFQVNKDILATNSPVLAKLIEENHDADRLVLRDITEKTFEEILNFMMTKNPPKETVDVIELYVASARLEMKDLIELTAGVLMDKVNSENALRIFTMCEKYNHKELSKKALSELTKKFAEL